MSRPIVKKFEKRKVYSSFKDNIWGADLADFDFDYALLTVLVNMHGLPLWKTKKVLQLLIIFKKI